MSGRTAAVLCLAVFFATATAPRDWMTATWKVLTAAVEEPAADPEGDPEIGPGGGDGGWLIDPNG